MVDDTAPTPLTAEPADAPFSPRICALCGTPESRPGHLHDSAIAPAPRAEPVPGRYVPPGLEPRGCPTPGACYCPTATPDAARSDALRAAKDFIEASIFNVPSKAATDAVLSQIGAALASSRTAEEDQ
ncbi:MAG TPA: hypothetical protein VN838_06760 [Bradyrhizobium sp.]|nr:hypothetical protein [Bradyrhizobium sp.]